jgi:hypothetical protein
MIATFTSSPHRRAYLASLALAGLVAILAVAGLVATLDLGARETLLEQRRTEMRAIVKRLAARGPEMARAERALSADPFLPGATPTLAANALQRRIVSLAEATGVTLRTIGTETIDAADGALPHVTLQATATARIAALQTLLYRIETEAPFVLVDELSLRAPQIENRGGVPSRDPDLEVDLRLIGYLRRNGG